MAILYKNDIVERYNKKQSTLLDEAGERRYSRNKLIENAKSFSYTETYDIFLSHSYDDARLVEQLRDMMVEEGFSVYVDWIEDDHLERGHVTTGTATILRNRMDRCNSLIYLTSQSAESSVWMPWELGYMDAKTKRVAVAPILDEDEHFDGREYLGLYPYFDLTNDKFYIHQSAKEWIDFKGWMSGGNPKPHTF